MLPRAFLRGKTSPKEDVNEAGEVNGNGKAKAKGKERKKPSLPYESSIPSRASTTDDSDDSFLADAIKRYKCNPKKSVKYLEKQGKKTLNFRWLKSRTNLKAAKSQKYCRRLKVKTSTKTRKTKIPRWKLLLGPN